MTIAGLNYNFTGQNGVSEVSGNSPHGASMIADNNGGHRPSETEPADVRHQVKRITERAAKLSD